MKLDMSNLTNLAEQIVQYAKTIADCEVQVKINSGTEFTAEVREQKIEKLVEASSKAISLKVVLDYKVATASSSDFKEQTIFTMVDNAIKRAKFTSIDKYASLPAKEEVAVKGELLKIFDPNILKTSPEEKIKLATNLEKLAMADKRITASSGAWCGTYINETILANSNGFLNSYKSSSANAGVYMQAGDKDNKVEDGWWSNAIGFEQLDKAETIASKAIHRVTRLLNSRKIASQSVPIVMEPAMTARLLSFFASCVNGRMVYMNQSYLAGKLNEKIAQSDLRIIDDGTMPGKMASRPFDSEGVPTRKMPILEDGVLKNYLLDTYSANKLGLKSTGHAGGSTNFYLDAGKHSPEEIIKSVDKGLLLVKTIGQGTMPSTGSISTGAYGIWIEKGELAYPVHEITINGNLAEILKNIEMIGNDLVFDRSIVGPTIKVNGISISGE